MSQDTDSLIYVAPLAELEAKGRMVVRGGRRPILVVWHEGRVHALDNRCPHLGFPLDRGTVEDGILTCHWHHARFDLASGGAFDLWADDVPTCEVVVRDGEVWIARACGFPDPAGHWRRRLGEGMAHNIGLVIGKAILGSLAAGADYRALVCDAALFGARNRDGWGVGLTILTALASLAPGLAEEEAYLALYHGIRRVAADCDSAAPRRDRQALAATGHSLATLRRWLRQWTAVRQRNAAERTLLTAVADGRTPGELADLMLSAVTDRYFSDGGHALDFINKSFECLDIIGWEHAPAVLPTTVADMISARGREESDSWRQPVDLVALVASAQEDLTGLIAEGRARAAPFTGHAALADGLLADEPGAIIDALRGAIRGGAGPCDLSRSLAYAAAQRIARFGTSNEFSDWDSAHHVFTYCNALDRLLRRASVHDDGGTGDAAHLAGILHGAMALYLTRYLNVPPARLPGEGGDDLDGLPAEAETLCDAILASFDRQAQVSESARLVARYLDCGHAPERLIATLNRALLREDAGFHSYQILEAGVRQFTEWGAGPEGRTILVAVTRYLAAHAPTERAEYQTARIARRLHLGGRVHDDEPTAAQDG